MTTLRRLTSLMAVIAMMLTLTAVPALAVAQGSAAITSDDLLSGQGGLVTVEISNDASSGIAGLGAGSSIDAFSIEVPQDLVDVAPSDVTLPEGWQGGYDADIGFVFAQATDGNELAPGDTLAVDLGVTADALADDRTRPFHTFVSDNGGTTLQSAGSPKVTSRILQIVDVDVVKPSVATNSNPLEVTEEQANAEFAVQVRNYGTQLRSVTTDVATNTDDSTSSVESTPATQDLASGANAVFEVGAVFGAEGSLVVDASATSDNSAARPLSSETITVQDAFEANLVADSLQPDAAVQGSITNISYRIDKTAGTQPVDATACLSLDDTSFETCQDQFFDAPLGEKNVNFDDVVIPDLANGEYSTSSTIDGHDANGAVVSEALRPGNLILDNLLPVVNITLDVGDPDVPGATPATTDNREITYDGSIGLSQGTEDCSNCSVTEAVLIAKPSNTEFPMNVTNNGGSLSGSGSFDFPDGTTSAVAEVTVQRDTTGASSTGTSNTIIVDLVLPELDDPAKTFRTDEADQIIVELDDDGILVDASMSSPIDWSVDNNTVTGVEGRPQGDGATQVILTLQNRLDNDATPTVSYQARPLITGRMHDRVSQEMLDQVIDTVDGIVPEAPVLETVNGLQLQDGEFWINDSTPEVALSNLAAGNVLEIFYDTNDNGAPDDGESVYSGSISNETETVTLDSLGTTEVSHDLIARMQDNAGNLGNLDTEVLNLDFTAASITDFTVVGQDVTVQFDEPVVRGRDATFDWTVLATDANGVQAHRTVTSVTVGDSASQRVLTISETSYDASAGGTVDGVRYKFRGFDAEDRYEDRATNLFGDVLFTKQ